jgi:hypothetical protein
MARIVLLAAALMLLPVMAPGAVVAPSFPPLAADPVGALRA